MVHVICWGCHKDTIDIERVHIVIFYQNKNRGILWRGHCNFYLTQTTIFTKMDVTLTILHRFSPFNFCNVPHTSNCTSSKKISHYPVPFPQEFFQNTLQSENGFQKCVKNDHIGKKIIWRTRWILQKSLCSLHVMVPIK